MASNNPAVDPAVQEILHLYQQVIHQCELALIREKAKVVEWLDGTQLSAQGLNSRIEVVFSLDVRGSDFPPVFDVTSEIILKPPDWSYPPQTHPAKMVIIDGGDFHVGIMQV